MPGFHRKPSSLEAERRGVAKGGEPNGEEMGGAGAGQRNRRTYSFLNALTQGDRSWRMYFLLHLCIFYSQWPTPLPTFCFSRRHRISLFSFSFLVKRGRKLFELFTNYLNATYSSLRGQGHAFSLPSRHLAQSREKCWRNRALRPSLPVCVSLPNLSSTNQTNQSQSRTKNKPLPLTQTTQSTRPHHNSSLVPTPPAALT